MAELPNGQLFNCVSAKRLVIVHLYRKNFAYLVSLYIHTYIFMRPPQMVWQHGNVAGSARIFHLSNNCVLKPPNHKYSSTPPLRPENNTNCGIKINYNCKWRILFEGWKRIGGEGPCWPQSVVIICCSGCICIVAISAGWLAHFSM